MWKIGNIEINNRVVLAPMAGISNPAYMKICCEMGVGLAFTELISAEAVVRNNQKTLDMLKGIETLNFPVAVQLFGANSDNMAIAAKKITSLYKNVFIDINMGCPVPKVAVRAQAGSALLKSPDRVFEIVSSVVRSVDVPVSVKIRSGWDFDHINAVSIAKVCEQAGASCITVHPRTRSQGYTGCADWNIIKTVKNAVNIPVIGNGDIKSPEDAKRMIDEVFCDAVMVGRGVLGNPWLIRNILNYFEDGTYNLPSREEKIKMCIRHLNYLCEFRSEKVAILEIRNHIGWYLKGLEGANIIKDKIYQCLSIHDILNILEIFLGGLNNEEERESW